MSGFLSFVLKRLCWMIATAWVVYTFSFFLMYAVPGGPYSRERRLPPILEQRYKERYRLDDPWIKQYAETVSAAIQSGAFPDGIRRLQSLLTSVAQQPDAGELVPYVKFRLLTAEYNRDIGQKDADFEKINTAYQEQLQQFVSTYSRSPDAAEAMLQLAIGAEFAGKTNDAIGWFGRIASDFPKDDLAPKAIGAKRRTILIQFLIEAASICLIGGVIAVAIAWPVTLLMQKFMPAVLSLTVVGIALLVALVTGLASGFFPAWRAARMNPVDALRNE